MAEERICATCGRRVWADDRFCAGCGTAFGGTGGRTDRVTSLPGFSYHFIQGVGWGLGLGFAGLIIALIPFLVLALAARGIR